MLDLIGQWKKRPERLGFEINSNSVRVVRLKKTSDDRNEVVSFGTFEIDIKNFTPTEQHELKSFLKQVGGRFSKAAVSIEDKSLRIRRMDFPKMPERDLIDAIRWNFREYIDCPIEEYTVGYTEIKRWNEGDNFAYSAFGVSNHAIKQYFDLAKQVGLKPVSIEPRATALLAAFNDTIVWEPKSISVCILLDEVNAYFIVMSDGMLLFSRPLPGISCEAFIKHLKREVGIDEEKAAGFLKKIIAGEELDIVDEEVSNINQNKNLTEVMSSFYSQLVVEIQRSIDAFCLMFKVDHVDKIYLCGSGAYLPNIVDHIQETLGIKTYIFMPFSKSENEYITPEDKSRSAIYAVAYGLAIP